MAAVAAADGGPREAAARPEDAWHDPPTTAGALAAYVGSAGLVLAAAGVGNYYAWRFVLSLLFLPSQVVYVVRQKDLEEARTKFLQDVKQAERVSIPVGGEGSGVALDGILLRHPSRTCNKYFVQFNANGVCYEEKLPIACDVQQLLKAPCHLLLVNYKGVGVSGGRTSCGRDLVDDGCAVLEWLRHAQGASLSNILVHGHSIGGAVAVLAGAAVARQDRAAARIAAARTGPQSSSSASNSSSPPSPATLSATASSTGTSASALPPASLPFIIADRTFSSLGEVVADKLGKDFDMSPIGGIMLVDLAAVLFAVARFGLGWAPPIIPGLAALTALGMAALAVGALNGSVSPTWPFDRAYRTASANLKPVIKYGVLGARTFGCTTLLLMLSGFFGPAWEYTVYLAALGVYLGRRGWLNAVSLRLVRFLGWDMDVRQAWDSLPQDRKLLLAHPRDGMIPSHVSLLKTNDPSDMVMLTSNFADPHMYDFFAVASERGQVLSAASRFFSSP